ncbi:mechanosensitive ion channel protein MscL [Actinotalea ferrariae CF5-4]|uniref:Large-conductance mechanosensitive channel n=1 Tax=Actinotalea ferrariae CF5-4 TaxID=948458 RepID=A0A021VP25_9CELL|nr:large conductance mechanosensitive channel protein MscL [Actinotalea ferrariae]EYR61825.1 mechanosensitive ion channel protein MscL [Actinotalea ferrariae CF5-4]
MLQGFKDFVMRGNVIELAVAVVIGTAFTGLVNSVVEGLVNPLVAAVGGGQDLSGTWTVALGSGADAPEISFGLVVGAVLNFLVIAAVVYFLIVLPMNTLAKRRKAGVEPEPPAPAEDVLVLQEIRDLLAARREV